MLRLVIAFASALITSPAAAQVQYWLPNGPGGTTYNNPQGSLSGTYYERALQRHADQNRWARERQQQQGSTQAAAGIVEAKGRIARRSHAGRRAGARLAAPLLLLAFPRPTVLVGMAL